MKSEFKAWKFIADTGNEALANGLSEPTMVRKAG